MRSRARPLISYAFCARLQTRSVASPHLLVVGPFLDLDAAKTVTYRNENRIVAEEKPTAEPSRIACPGRQSALTVNGGPLGPASPHVKHAAVPDMASRTCWPWTSAAVRAWPSR